MSIGWDKHILLWGMPGSGKSSVGPLLSERLGRPFFDLDDLIEDAEGMSVSEIFAVSGEAVFRKLERRILRSVLARDTPSVVALGGGALLDAQMRQSVMLAATVVTLGADLQTLVNRLEHCDERPLLTGQDLVTMCSNVLALRSSAYGDIPYQIDTTGLSPEEVARDIGCLGRCTPSLMMLSVQW